MSRSDTPDPSRLRRLAQQVSIYAPHDGRFELRVPGTFAFRRSRVTREPVHATVGPMLCVVAQGAKVAMLGREVYEYGTARMLVFSMGLPIAGHVTRATPAEPFLGFGLVLNPQKIAELARKVYPNGAPKPASSRGISVSTTPDGMLDAVIRLMDLMARPSEVELLAPLVIDEILIRLLQSPIGSRVAQIGLSESGIQRVAKAVSSISANFAQPISVEQLARLVNMSVSSFHQRFRAVTSMSPLQYQKVLRLHEARRLMLFHDMDAATSCQRVGYVSPSQFSREYSRFFGNAPARDVARLRESSFSSESATILWNRSSSSGWLLPLDWAWARRQPRATDSSWPTMHSCRSLPTIRTTTRARSWPASTTSGTNLVAAASSSTISTGRCTSSTSRRRDSQRISISMA